MSVNSGYVFSFDSYKLPDPHTLVFHYSYRNAQSETIGSFAEKYVLPVDLQADETTQYLLQQLHIIVGVSYYKSLLGSVALPYPLSAGEADYWNTVYDHGLAEYAYLNRLSEPIRPFTAGGSGRSAAHKPRHLPDLQGALLGIGGGKDSIVAGEILKGIDLDTVTLHMATGTHTGQAGAVMDVMQLPQYHIERYLDTAIIDFTELHQGNNGHIPLSAILAWLGILITYASKHQYVVMANESAASVGNVTWNGRLVNHQWSKSLAFERLTQDFVHQHLSPDLFYFSPIRPYGSLAVMSLFAKLGSAYLDDFTSCNLVLRIDPAQRPNGRWCTHCAKCLSTWLLLSAFLPLSKLEAIFGRNLFDDTSLRTLLEELLGLRGHKPLDCVGTIEELRAVTREALQQHSRAALLNGLAAKQLPGPSLEELMATTGDSTMPADVRTKVAAFVSNSLQAD
jgi:UDP-N-acetyl-alpha-D-muramoyl-L-alanyl-L-glutamate epimerase